jgi:hypothetical protein
MRVVSAGRAYVDHCDKCHPEGSCVGPPDRRRNRPRSSGRFSGPVGALPERATRIVAPREVPSVRFFIPYLKDDPEAAEVQWQAWLVASSAPGSGRRIYSIDCEHESSRFEVTVGKPRKEYKRRTGPRRASIEKADYDRLGAETGTEVSGIVAAGGQIYVWRTVRHSAAGRTLRWLTRARSDASTTSTTSPDRKPIARFHPVSGP